jgi:hypothetical protein
MQITWSPSLLRFPPAVFFAAPGAPLLAPDVCERVARLLRST